ncbi:hypothetical protein BL243_24540 [Ralstonia solanacearum]|nr:hypothetical protein BL243_24540 [Ralstonia solanacearum]
MPILFIQRVDYNECPDSCGFARCIKRAEELLHLKMPRQIQVPKDLAPRFGIRQFSAEHH